MPYEDEKKDPRFLPGSISGLGMEESDTQGQMVVDMRYGIHLLKTDGCMVHHPEPGRFLLAYTMEGTVGRTDELARAMFLLKPEKAALVVRQLFGALAQRAPDYAREQIGLLKEMVPEPPVHTEDPPLVSAAAVMDAEAADATAGGVKHEAEPLEDESPPRVPQDRLVAGRLSAGRPAA